MKKFTDAMYAKIGLDVRSPARNAPADGGHDFTRSYRLKEDRDKGSLQELRELAGLEPGHMKFPNPSGAVQLSPVVGESLFSERGKLDQIKRMKRIPRLYESDLREEQQMVKEFKKQLRALAGKVERAESVDELRVAVSALQRKLGNVNKVLGRGDDE